ncbi:MAG: hypothetical protein JWO00_409 [Candidatus Parcubacteria bacterium]|nr:hypothetical protein [Candidatus Parcubacteria bacterium]
MIIFFIIGIVLGAFVVIFALQNITPVTVMFFDWQIQGSLAFILILAVAIGLLISALLSLPDIFRKSFMISKLKKHNEKLKDELVTKEIEVETEKSKLDANNAYIDDLEKTPRV